MIIKTWKTYSKIFKIFKCENQIFENPENQPKWLATLFVLNKLIEKSGCIQNLRVVEPIIMANFIFVENPVEGE